MENNQIERNSFYTEHIPQSEYRRIEKRSRGDRTKLSTQLTLPPLSATEKIALREKIIQENQQLLSILLPPSIATQVGQELYLNTVLNQLGL